MNFGQNLYQWFLSNAQSLVLMAIVVIVLPVGRAYQAQRGRQRIYGTYPLSWFAEIRRVFLYL